MKTAWDETAVEGFLLVGQVQVVGYQIYYTGTVSGTYVVLFYDIWALRVQNVNISVLLLR